MNISQRLRTCAKHTGLDAVIELLQEAADEIDRLSASAALPTLRPGDSHMESLIEAAIQGHASTRDAMRWLVRQLVPATPEPVGFTYQAEIEYADSTGGNGSFWRVPPDLDDEAVPLYTHQAPSVPGDVVRDAKRYEWLRKADRWPCVFPDYFDPEPLAGSELDECVDAAMLAAK